MTDAATKPTIAKAGRRVGRPRKLTLDRVIDASLEMGLEDLTMASLAARLGVAVGVIYNYVGSRDELVRLASVRAAQHHVFPADCEQHWSTYIIEHAGALFELLISDSQLVASFAGGGLGPPAQIDNIESWLEALTRRGFAADEALRIYRAIGLIVVGGAISHAHIKALAATGSPFEERVYRAVEERSVDEVPLLKGQVAAYASEDEFCDWRHAMYLMLHGIAVIRGETLPPSAQ